MELPAADGRLEADAGAGHRLHGDHQAGHGNPADRHAPGRAGAGSGYSGRRVQRGHRWRRLSRWRADRTPIGQLITRTVSDLETIADIFSEGLIVIVGDIAHQKINISNDEFIVDSITIWRNRIINF